jgi:hypothetical protein
MSAANSNSDLGALFDGHIEKEFPRFLLATDGGKGRVRNTVPAGTYRQAATEERLRLFSYARHHVVSRYRDKSQAC